MVVPSKGEVAPLSQELGAADGAGGTPPSGSFYALLGWSVLTQLFFLVVGGDGRENLRIFFINIPDPSKIRICTVYTTNLYLLGWVGLVWRQFCVHCGPSFAWVLLFCLSSINTRVTKVQWRLEVFYKISWYKKNSRVHHSIWLIYLLLNFILCILCYWPLCAALLKLQCRASRKEKK